MTTPSAPDARLFFRCALQRHDDAQVLLRYDHTTGAVYLAGYGIECILKALILSGVPRKEQPGEIATFRGAVAHDFAWLLAVYRRMNSPPFSPEINEAFTLVNDWSTELRYPPAVLKPQEAEEFLEATRRIMTWAKSRL